MAVSDVDPSEFAVSVAVGSAHVLGSALDSLGRATRSPVAAALLAVPVLVAYLAAVTLAFAVRVFADAYAGIVVACGGGGGDDDDTVTRQAAAAILGWLAGLVVRLAVPALLVSGLSFACALLKFSSD